MPYRRLPTPTRLRLAARTDVGPARTWNEDGLLVSDLSSREQAEGDDFSVSLENTMGYAIAVIDGMGGARSGALPTGIAKDVFHAVLTTGLDMTDEAFRRRLVIAMNAASRAIFDRSTSDPLVAGIGAVAVLALILGDRLHLANVGNTRAYLHRLGRLVQLTRDDSLQSDAIAAGLPPEEIAELPTNVVTKALGLRESVDVVTETFPLCAGDVLLFCSDGLYREAGDAAIERVLRDHGDDLGAAHLELFGAAVNGGGNDNITFVVARPEGPLREPGPEDVIESRNLPSR
jgi:protein phosphatase